MNNLPENSVEEISFRDIFINVKQWLIFLKTKLIYILLTSLIGSLLGFLYSIIQPTLYTAKITFVVEENKANGGLSALSGLSSLAGQFGVDVGGSGGGGILSGDNVLLYFRSENISRDVFLSKFDENSSNTIADIYAESYGLKKKWLKNPNIGKIDFYSISNNKTYNRLRDSLMQTLIKRVLEKSLEVSKTDKKASFIEVKTTMNNELLTKIYCERTVKIAIDKYVSLKTQRQKLSVEKLQKRLDSISLLLTSKTSSSASLQTINNTMDINPLYKTGTSISVETTQRDKTMLNTIFASVVQSLELSKFSLNQDTPVIQIIDNSNLPLIRTEPSKIKNSLLLGVLFFVLSSLYFSIKKAFK